MGNGYTNIGALGYGPFYTGFGLFGIMFTIVFVLILGVFIVVAVKGISQWSRNNHSPRLTVEATVVSKRMDYRRHSSTNHVSHGHTTYYVTFQVASGDRMELNLSGQEYGLIVEGDWGDLTFQGTRYLGFSRKVKSYDDV